MPDLNLDLNYFEHPKTVRTVALLGVGSDVLPIKLWRYCGKFHAADGILRGYTNEAIESVCGWRGPKGKMVKAFIEVAWLHELHDDSGAAIGYQVHDWLEHQGHLDAYKRRGKAAARARWQKLEPGNAASNASGMQQASNKHTGCNAPAVPAILTKEVHSLAREGSGLPPEAAIPTSKEIAEFFSVRGIPPDYCEHYHAQKTIRNGWVVNGQLIQWRVELPRWWVKDAPTWFNGPNGNARQSNTAPPSSVPKPKSKTL
jgi:hypothetical protein